MQGHSMSDDQSAFKKPSESPSTILHKALVTLCGLSYGERDGGVERARTSMRVWQVVQYWGSGLMKAEGSDKDVDETANKFEDLVLNELASSMLHWDFISTIDGIDTLKNIVSFYSRHVSVLNKTERSLRVISLLLRRFLKLYRDKDVTVVDIKDVPNILYACVRLRATLDIYECENIAQNMKKETVENNLALKSLTEDVANAVREARHVTSLSRLYAEHLGTIALLCKVATEIDESTKKSNEKVIAPACAALNVALDYALQGNNTERIQRVLPSVLDTFGDSACSSTPDIRLSALNGLSLLLIPTDKQLLESPLLFPKPQLRKLVGTHLPGALLWCDAPSVTTCVPLLSMAISRLQTQDPPPPLSRGASREYDTAISTLLKTARVLVDKAIRCSAANDEDERNDGMRLGQAAALTLSILPTITKHRLLPIVPDVLSLSIRILPNVACTHAVIDAADALTGTLSMTWPMRHAISKFIRQSFSAALTALIKAHRTSNRSVEQRCEEAIKSIISRLAILNTQTTLNLVNVAASRANKYASLKTVGTFLSKIERDLSQEHDRAEKQVDLDKGKGAMWSPVLNEFFGKKYETARI